MGTADELRKLADRMARSGGKRVVLTVESAETMAHALRAYADYLSRPRSEHPTFTVDVWDERGVSVIETMARCSNLCVARGAFERAVEQRGRYEVTLRNGAHVVAVHRPAEGQPNARQD